MHHFTAIRQHAESLGLTAAATLFAWVTHETFLKWIGLGVSVCMVGTAISREYRLWKRPDQRA